MINFARFPSQTVPSYSLLQIRKNFHPQLVAFLIDSTEGELPSCKHITSAKKKDLNVPCAFAIDKREPVWKLVK